MKENYLSSEQENEKNTWLYNTGNSHGMKENSHGHEEMYD